jgi:hypothetical protein
VSAHLERRTRLAGGRTYCSCGASWPCPRAAEPVVTTTMFTPAEQAAWEVAVERGLAVTAADLRALLKAVGTPEAAPAAAGTGED